MFFLTEQSQFLLETKRLLTEQSQFLTEQSQFWMEQNGLDACGPGRVLILAGMRGCTTNFRKKPIFDKPFVFNIGFQSSNGDRHSLKFERAKPFWGASVTRRWWMPGLSAAVEKWSNEANFG